MAFRWAWLAVSIGVFVASCGNESAEPSGATSSGGGGSSAANAGNTSSGAGAGGENNDEGFSVSIGSIEVAPGEEDTRCVIKRLGNTEAFHAGVLHNTLTAGSHHLIVYRTNDTDEQPEPFSCSPFSDTLDPAKGSPLMISQKADDRLELPNGVGFSVAANQMVRLEMHYLNASSETLSVRATSTFVPMSEAEFTDEGDILFIGDPDIDIPAMSSETLGPVYFPLPGEVGDPKFFGITGHTHRWGTNVSVSIAAGEDAPGTPVYEVENWKWSEPETVYHDPPFHVPAGGGFQFSCSWDNQGPTAVRFGESATREMCFFWAYYYPSKGGYVCFHTEQVGGLDFCCPGAAPCGYIF